MGYRSIHGRVFGYNEGGLLFNGRPVGDRLAGRGMTYYVDSAVDGASGSSPDEGVGTLDEAFALCTANRGDTIVVMPNHAETVTGVGGIAADVAGVAVVGLGSYNQRPRILMDGGTTVTAAISAADVTFRNLVFASGNASVVTGINVTGVGCWLDEIEFADNTTSENWVTPIKATGAANTADGLKITNCRWVPLIASTVGEEFLEITDDIKDLVIVGNFIVHEGTASPLFLQAGTKVMTRALVMWNLLSHKMTAGDLAYDNGGSANSGIIAHNRIGHADVSTAHVLGAVAGCRFFDNLSVSTDALSGFVLPAVDVDS